MLHAPDTTMATGGGAAAVAQSQRPIRRAWHLVARVLVTLVATAVVLVALEGATRLFSHTTPPLLCNDPVLGTKYLPGFAGEVYIPECDREVFLRFNADGLRGPDVPRVKQAGVCRIAVIGDSMIAAVATDEEKTLVRRLADRLNDKHSARPAGPARYEVLNFGISGSSTGQELVMYRELVRDYRPDIVVCAFCVANDLGDNCNRLTSNRSRVYFDVDDGGGLYEVPRSAGRVRLASWLNRHSRFYVWQRGATQTAINTLRSGARQLAAQAGHELAALESGGQGIFCTAPRGTVAHAWRVTEKILDTMHREVVADGSQFLLAVLPAGWQVCDEAWANVVAEAGSLPIAQDHPDQALTAIARRLNMPVVVMTERFRAAAPHHSWHYEDEILHFAGVGHFNDRGNDLAAEAIYEALVDRPPYAQVTSASR